MNEDLNTIQRQVVDLQERVTALEAAARAGSPTAGGDLAGLLSAAVSVAGRIARSASIPQPAPQSPSEGAGERPLGRLAARLTELREEHPATGHTGAGIGGPSTPASRPNLFPITEDRSGVRTNPAAQYAGRTAPRRPLPPEAPVRLWNRDYTEHIDVIGRAASGGLDGVQRIRIRDEDAAAALGWLAQGRKHDGAFVAWMDRVWAVESWVHTRGADVKLDLLPLPKPPRVDQVLGREPFPPGPTPAEHPGYTVADLTAMKDRIAKGYEESRGLDKTRCPGCTNPTEHGHYPWCAQAHPLSEVLEQPEAYTMPDGVGLGTVPEYGQPVGLCPATRDGYTCTELTGHPGDHIARGSRGFIHGTWADGPVGTVTSGLIHVDGEPPLPNPLPPSPDMELTNDYDEPDVDEVLPMPGGPNDKLTHGAQAAADAVRSAEFLREHPTAMHPETAQAIARHGYGDLYSRLDHLHDAVDTESDE